MSATGEKSRDGTILVDPAITKGYRRLFQSIYRRMVTMLSSHESVLRTKDKGSDALHLRADSRLFKLRPWAQDFSPIGIRTRYDDCRNPWIEHLVNLIRATLGRRTDTSGGFVNQYVRDKTILPLLKTTFLDLLKDRQNLHFLDTFSSEGLYSYYVSAKFKNVASVTGIDLDTRRIQRAETIREAMDCGANIRFKVMNVFDLSLDDRFDVTLCMGGLYHTGEPGKVIDLLSAVTRHILIVHTLIAWDQDKGDDFIITPAPGLQHGSRFSYQYVRRCIKDNGWSIGSEGSHVYPGTFNHYWNSKAAWFFCRK